MIDVCILVSTVLPLHVDVLMGKHLHRHFAMDALVTLGPCQRMVLPRFIPPHARVTMLRPSRVLVQAFAVCQSRGGLLENPRTFCGQATAFANSWVVMTVRTFAPIALLRPPLPILTSILARHPQRAVQRFLPQQGRYGIADGSRIARAVVFMDIFA